MQQQDFISFTTEKVDVPVTTVIQKDIVTSVVHEPKFVLGADDNVQTFKGPLLGVWHGPVNRTVDVWQDAQGRYTYDSFEAWLGRPLDFISDFCNGMDWWNTYNQTWQFTPFQKWLQGRAGRKFLYATYPFPKGAKNSDDTPVTLRNVADGRYDFYWQFFADNLVKYNMTDGYIRIGHEMDGHWITGWYEAPEGNAQKCKDFADAFRRIVQVMRDRQPNANWKFLICVAEDWKDRNYLDAVWPGDDVCDLVGMDFYDASWEANTYPLPAGASEAEKAERRENSWNKHIYRLLTIRDFARAHSKSMCIPEFAASWIRTDKNADGTIQPSHTGLDNPYWIRQFGEFVMNPENNVEFVALFNGWGSYGDSLISYPWNTRTEPTKFPLAAEVFKQLFSSTKTRFKASGFVN
jgi:hypothetical protein